MENIVYLITRTDGQKYVGITCEFKKRMGVHKKSKRFEQGIESIEILADCETYEKAEQLEPAYIKKYDTFYNGLNESIDGKGNHLALNFNTRGYKFTNEQRQNMKSNHWSKNIKNTWTKTGIHSDQQKELWSKKRKGKAWGGRKVPRETVLNIIKLYNEDIMQFDNDFIRQFVKTTHKNKVGELPLEELKAPNGKPLNKIKLYAEFFSKEYGVTNQAIRGMLTKGVAEDYEHTN